MTTPTSPAACDGMDVNIFFSADDFSHPHLTAAERDELNSDNTLRAKMTCRICPVREACLAENLDARHGIYGGLAVEQRDNVRRSGRSKNILPRQHTPETMRFSPMAAEMVSSLMAGESSREIAQRLNVTEKTVRASFLAELV